MLIEILELYGTRFNFDRVGVAIDDGGAYFDKLDYQLVNQNVWRAICIRDPNDPNNNIAKASHQINKIIKVFYDAFGELTKRCYLVHSRIQAELEAPWGTPCGSILDSIIEIPPLTVRDRLKRLWKVNMEGMDTAVQGISGEQAPQIQIESQREEKPEIARENPSKAKKMVRRERRAAERAEMKKKRVNGASEAVDVPAPSPICRKTSQRTSSSGTKDTPIVLDD
jgi:DNA polymerase sigma